MARDYRHEYDSYHGTPEQIKKRQMRNEARAMIKEKYKARRARLDKGDEVDHIRSLSNGGTNAKSNLRVVSRRENRRKGSK